MTNTNEKKIIYVDNAATTAVRPEVLAAMTGYFTENYGNPSSIYNIAKTSRRAIDAAREHVANIIGAAAGEIFFTGSGTEADNWAIKGVCGAHAKRGSHIITTEIEHHAVLHTCEYLAARGFTVTYLPVDKNGLISIDDLREAILPETVLISVMFANNEIGTIQPIKEIGAIARQNGILFHTDAVQAVGHIDIDVNELNIDLLSMSAHKLHGPKGVGALYIRKGTKIENFVHGGAQENKRRAGTENVAGIVGFGEACRLAKMELESEAKRLTELRDATISAITTRIPRCFLNGDPVRRLPGNVNISFEFIEGEGILLMLNYKGICASSGSACTSGSLDPSHVLLAIGLPHENAHGSVRITFGKYNNKEEIDILVDALAEIVAKLRAMSPLGAKN